METTEIIRKLREIIETLWTTHPYETDVIREAADRLEELDERIAIMMENEPGGDDTFENERMVERGGGACVEDVLLGAEEQRI